MYAMHFTPMIRAPVPPKKKAAAPPQPRLKKQDARARIDNKPAKVGHRAESRKSIAYPDQINLGVYGIPADTHGPQEDRRALDGVSEQLGARQKAEHADKLSWYEAKSPRNPEGSTMSKDYADRKLDQAKEKLKHRSVAQKEMLKMREAEMIDRSRDRHRHDRARYGRRDDDHTDSPSRVTQFDDAQKRSELSVQRSVELKDKLQSFQDENDRLKQKFRKLQLESIYTPREVTLRDRYKELQEENTRLRGRVKRREAQIKIISLQQATDDTVAMREAPSQTSPPPIPRHRDVQEMGTEPRKPEYSVRHNPVYSVYHKPEFSCMDVIKPSRTCAVL